MAINSKRMQDIAILSIAVVVIQMLLSNYVYKYLFANATQQVFGILPTNMVNPYTAIGSLTVGDKILAYLSGIVPIGLGNFAGWISMFIGAFILLYIGYFVYEQNWAWKGKNETQRIWAILLYGTIALGLVLWVTKMGSPVGFSMTILLGLAINYLILSAVISWAAKSFNFLRV